MMAFGYTITKPFHKHNVELRYTPIFQQNSKNAFYKYSYSISIVLVGKILEQISGLDASKSLTY